MKALKKEKIDNKFLDLISYIISLFFSIYRSIKLLLLNKNNIKKWKFYKIFDFLFVIWPKYFWKEANSYKLFSFIEKFIDYLFYQKK